jgi:large subunit ribosomal protein L19
MGNIMATKTNVQFLPKETAARKDLDLRSGDTVKVHLKITEKGKTRIQLFEGIVIARKHGTESGGTFTVRKMSHGIGVERVFPLYSPMLEKIEVVRRSNMRRSKLYFLRDKTTREIRRKMRKFTDIFLTTLGLAPLEPEVITQVPAVEEENVTETEVVENLSREDELEVKAAHAIEEQQDAEVQEEVATEKPEEIAETETTKE